MARILRGEIRWADLSPTRGQEPEGQPPSAGFPLTLELRSKGLPKRSWVKISQVRTLAPERIGKRVGQATPEEMIQVLEGLNEVVGA